MQEVTPRDRIMRKIMLSAILALVVIIATVDTIEFIKISNMERMMDAMYVNIGTWCPDVNDNKL